MQALGGAYEKYGFVILQNHGVSDDLISRALDGSKRFFALGEEEKKKPSEGTDHDDDDDENRTASESPAVDAVEDALRFLFSKDGKIVRDNVVEDALDALEAFLEDDRDDDDFEKKKKKKEEESTVDSSGGSEGQDNNFNNNALTLDQLLVAFRATAAATSDRPDLWIPAVGKYAWRKESADMCVKLAAGALERAPEVKTANDAAEIARKVIHAMTRKRKSEREKREVVVEGEKGRKPSSM